MSIELGGNCKICTGPLRFVKWQWNDELGIQDAIYQCQNCGRLHITDYSEDDILYIRREFQEG